jgi:hypothetical protein
LVKIEVKKEESENIFKEKQRKNKKNEKKIT